MLTGSSLGDDSSLFHSSGQKNLPQGVVNFVRAGMKQVFTLQVDLCTARVFRQTFCVKQWRRPTSIIPEQALQL
jgi:hypothetical protein